MPPFRRLLVSIYIGVMAFALAAAYRVYVQEAVGDLYFPFCAAGALVHGVDPYGGACRIMWQGAIFPPNPLTTAMVAVPFLPLGGIGAVTLWAVGVGLLSYGLMQDRAWWRLLVLLSPPVWVALQWLQWSPLLAAVYLLPGLLPLTLIKPQIGFPVALLRITWRRALGCVGFLALSLAIDPTWPLRWLPQTRSYDGFIPLLLFPLGPLLLLALLRWRDERARLLFLMACMPQRGWYDLTLLWLIPQDPRELVLLLTVGWLGYGLCWFVSPRIAITGLVYLIALALVLQPVFSALWRAWFAPRTEILQIVRGTPERAPLTPGD